MEGRGSKTISGAMFHLKEKMPLHANCDKTTVMQVHPVGQLIQARRVTNIVFVMLAVCNGRLDDMCSKYTVHMRPMVYGEVRTRYLGVCIMCFTCFWSDANFRER